MGQESQPVKEVRDFTKVTLPLKDGRKEMGKGRKGEKQEEGKGRYYGGAARLLMRSDNPNPPENQDSCSQIKPVRNKKTLALCSPAFVKTKKQAVSIHFGSRFYLHIKKPPTPVASLLPA